MTIYSSQNNSVIPAPEPGSPKQFDSAKITFSGGPRSRACGDDDFYSCHPDLNYTVIPASEPGSTKQSGSLKTACFYHLVLCIAKYCHRADQVKA